MRNNITYLLGAGASFHCMPLVNSMNDRMFYFLYLMNPQNGTSDSSLIKNETQIVYEEFKDTLEEASKHKTIDTYAKKLWLTNQSEKLHKLKVLIDLYFTFEQDISKDIYKNAKLLFKNVKENELWPLIGKTKDYRYDVFFATLLDKKIELPENINIVSWNYDYQIEIAYSEYISNKEPNSISTNLRIFPNNTIDLQTHEFTIIKLNGQVELNLENSNEGGLRSKLNLFIDKGISEYKTSISFAWELDDEHEQRILYAEEIFAKTTELVVIGYSFPSFNRSVDARLFSKLKNIEKIKVQCPQENYNSIFSSIKDMPFWERHNFNNVVELHNELEQFYIPSNQLC